MTVVINGTTGITSVNGSAAAPSVTGADTDTGIVYGTNTLSLATGGTTAVTVDSSQNVGIGTSSPSYKLDVQGNGDVYAHVRNNTSGSGAARLLLTNNGDSGFGIINNSGASGVVNLLNYKAAPMAFWTDSTERMRIDSSGNLLVGMTSGVYGARLCVTGGIASKGSVQFNIDGTAATNFEWVLRLGSGMQFYVNNASVMATLSSSGVWTNASDARYKENIRPVTYGLAEVMQLQPRAYNIIGSEKQEIGFVAQEVEPILPELVESSMNSVTEEERLTLSYGQMSAVLVKAIQEQQAIIEQLRADVEALKAA